MTCEKQFDCGSILNSDTNDENYNIMLHDIEEIYNKRDYDIRGDHRARFSAN